VQIADQGVATSIAVSSAFACGCAQNRVLLAPLAPRRPVFGALQTIYKEE
jgi:hypothetical protein